MVLSLRSLMKNTNTALATGGNVRAVSATNDREVTITPIAFPFTMLTYNTALLMGTPTLSWLIYKGWDRDVAMDEFIRRIAGLAPDFVHLCEVFDNDDRRKIIRHPSIRSIYPYTTEGPDEHDLDEDGGNLILSKTPFLANNHMVFDEGFGADGYSNKGVIHIRVCPEGAPCACDVFASHMQDILASRIFEAGSARGALYDQLTQTAQMIEDFSDPDTPTFLVGDLNVPAESADDYCQMMSRLNNPVDLWLVGHEAGTGQTNVSANNFGNADSATDQRLDYMLMKPGAQFIPQLDSLEIQQWSRGGRQISDHFGLLATWTHAAKIQMTNEPVELMAAADSEFVGSHHRMTTYHRGSLDLR